MTVAQLMRSLDYETWESRPSLLWFAFGKEYLRAVHETYRVRAEAGTKWEPATKQS